MTVLFRWIFFSSLTRVAAIMIAVVAVFMIAESFDKARFIGERMGFELLVEYLFLKIPFMISEFMPVIVLIATAIYMTEISHHHELVAIRAAGIQMPKLMNPLLAAGAVAALFTFAVGEWVEPVTNERLSYIERVNIAQKKPVKQGVQWLKEGDTLFRLTPLVDNYFALLMLKTDKHGGWLERVDADKAKYVDGVWHLEKAYINQPSETNMLRMQVKLDYKLVSNISPETVAAPKPRNMQWLELYEFEKNLAQSGLASDSYVFQLHRKLAAPLGCLIMVVLAYSLCSNMGGRVSANSKGLLLAIVLGLAFYVFASAITVFVTGGQLPVVYAAWLPNILFTGLAGYFLLAREGH